MKKSLVGIGLMLLTACNSTSLDGLGTVEGRVTFMDADSVVFCTALEVTDVTEECKNEYAFTPDTVVKFYQDGELTMLPPEAAALEIMTSSNSDDYLFTFVVTDDKVLEMTQIEPVSSEKVMAPKPFYLTDVTVVDGEQMITADFVEWLSESEGTCHDYNSDTKGDSLIPDCNPNGFLVMNESTEDTMFYTIPKDTPVIVYNVILSVHPETKTVEGTETISFEDLLAAFDTNPEFFAVTPFELEYGTVGDMTDQISALKEIYIP